MTNDGGTDELQAEFPHWRVWRSRDKVGALVGWYATRDRDLTVEEIKSGLEATVSGDTAELLRARLADQTRLESQADPS